MKKNISIDTIGGHHDHIHVLMLQNKHHGIAMQMQLLKGESSHWANRIGFLDTHFEWCREYFADSVSRKAVPAVRRYINNQADHHAHTTLPCELKQLFSLSDKDLPADWQERPPAG